MKGESLPHIYANTDTQTDRQTNRQTDRQTDKETECQTHRHTDCSDVVWWVTVSNSQMNLKLAAKRGWKDSSDTQIHLQILVSETV